MGALFLYRPSQSSVNIMKILLVIALFGAIQARPDPWFYHGLPHVPLVYTVPPSKSSPATCAKTKQEKKSHALKELPPILPTTPLQERNARLRLMPKLIHGCTMVDTMADGVDTMDLDIMAITVS